MVLDETSPARNLLQYVRDEAHRFATSFNKNLRKKDIRFSALESIPGIGSARSIIIMDKFKNIETLKKADPYEIRDKTGIPLSAAENILKYFKNNISED